MLNHFKTMQKIDWAILGAQALLLVLYLAPLSLILMYGSVFLSSLLIYYSVVTMAMGAAYTVMFFRLEGVREQKIVRFWLTIASALAPVSAYLYIYVHVYYLQPFYQSLLHPVWVLVLPLISVVIGFCMPFILLTFWVKYRYREDEF
jgi:hypothetical protein